MYDIKNKLKTLRYIYFDAPFLEGIATEALEEIYRLEEEVARLRKSQSKALGEAQEISATILKGLLEKH